MNNELLKRSRFPLLVGLVLLLNAAGWLLVRQDLRSERQRESTLDGSALMESGRSEAPAAVPLTLTRLAQASLSTNRLLTIGCQFAAAVEWPSFAERLKLTAEGVPVAWRFVGDPQDRHAQIQTDVPVAGDRITAVLAPGVRSTDTRFKPTAERIEALLAVTSEFRFSEASSTTPSFGQPGIHLEFTQAVDVEQARACIASDPPVPFTVRPLSWRGGLILEGGFTVGQPYTLILDPKLRASSGHQLDLEVRRTVFIHERAPAMRIDVPGRYLAPMGALVVPVLTVNTPQVVSSLRPILPQNLVQFAMREAGQYADWSAYGNLDSAAGDALTGPSVSRTNRLTVARNTEERLFLRLRDHLPADTTRGVFLLTLTAEKTAPEIRLICISDIGLSVRSEESALHIWTTSLRAGRAAAGLEVTLYGRNNAPIDSAVSDAEGLVKLAFDAAIDEPFLVVAQNPESHDMTFLPLTNATEVRQTAETTRSYLAPMACEASLFTERDLYRHGEKAFVQALLRRADGSAPETFPVVLKVLKPDGRLFSQSTLIADARGAITTEVTFPEYLPSGTYRLQLALPGEKGIVLGSHAVMLEAFVPPQIRVNLRDLPDRLKLGDALTCTLTSEHLFGKPAAGLQAEVDVSYLPLKAEPPGWKDYRFGDSERKPLLPKIVASRQTLSDAGTASFSVTLPTGILPAARLQAIVQGTVFELGGRGVTARERITVDPYPFYIGVKPPSANIARPGSPLTFHAAAVRPDGARAPQTVPLTVSVEQISWVSNLRRDDSGSYVWSSRAVRTPVLTGEASATEQEDAAFTLTAPNAGDYEICFVDPVSKAATRCAFTTGDVAQSLGSRDRSSPERVELIFDREVYAPGETARMQIRAPFAGVAWVTLQRDTIIESRVVKLTGNTAELQWKITEDLTPNAEVAVSVVRAAAAETVWSAHRATGLAPLRVQPPDRRLTVAVVPPAAVARPYEPLSVSVQVRDHAGAAVTNGALTLLAVDEGICQLTDFHTPDPWAHFMAVRAGQLAFHDLYRQWMPITDEALQGAASHTGGDGAAELLKRLNPIAARRFKPVALWQANVALDASGETTIPLDLPEFAGELRLMAVAWDTRAVGSADASIKIRRKLVVQPDLPRVLAPHDRAMLTLALHNESGAACEATVAVKTEGPLTCPVGKQGLTLEVGESRTLIVPIEASESVGLSRVTVTVEGAGEHYAETIELAIRPTQAWQVITEYAKVAPGASHAFESPAGVVLSSVDQSFSCAQRPTVNLLGALEYVTEYPYGCLEQTVSSVFPLLALRKQGVPIIPPTSTLAQEAPGRIRAALTRIMSMQRYSGFAMWPDVTDSDQFCTIYAAHFLVEAHAADYPVGRQTLSEILGMLDNLDYRTSDTQLAYAAMVQAIAGKPDFARMSKLLEREASLPPEARFLLGRALMRAGETETGRRIIAATGLPGNLRDAAFGTLAWLEIDPAAAQTAACCLEIQRHRRATGHWGSTQDNMLALLALGEYARHTVADEQPIAPVFVWSGGRYAAGPTNAVVWHPDQRAASQNLVLTNAGSSAIYVSRRIRAVPTAEAQPDVDAGLKIRRQWLDRDGEPLDTARLTRGDLIVVRLTLTVPPETGGNLIIEDLLPACLEIENGDVARGGMLAWLDANASQWVLHREVRDDRLLLFADGLSGQKTFHYAARVVTAGEFAIPPVTVSDMYTPERMSRNGGGRVTVTMP